MSSSLLSIAVILSFLPQRASALTMDVSGGEFGFAITWGEILTSILQTLVVTIVPLAIAAFIAGAGMFIISAGNDGLRSIGKRVMINALIGVGIVVGAKAILHTTLFFIYG